MVAQGHEPTKRAPDRTKIAERMKHHGLNETSWNKTNEKKYGNGLNPKRTPNPRPTPRVAQSTTRAIATFPPPPKKKTITRRFCHAHACRRHAKTGQPPGRRAGHRPAALLPLSPFARGPAPSSPPAALPGGRAPSHSRRDATTFGRFSERNHGGSDRGGGRRGRGERTSRGAKTRASVPPGFGRGHANVGRSGRERVGGRGAAIIVSWREHSGRE